MSSSSPGLFADSKATIRGDHGRAVLWLVWQCVRLPLLLLLVALEPVASLVLGALALLGVLTAFFRQLVGPPHFTFLLVLGISLGFQLVLLVYYKLLSLLRC
jgi:hypothetical protein